VHSSLKAAALRYAANGWPVFVLGRTKHPVANCAACKPVSGIVPHDPQGCRCLTCHSFYAATREPRVIARMLAMVPAGLLAIRTGAASGLVVIDVDPAHGGTQSLAVLRDRGLLAPTRFVRTGSGGLHLYYRHPGPHLKIKCSQGQLGPGIDVRADGGYIVAPPSVHPLTGHPYLWADENAAIAEMHRALRAECSPPTTPPPAPRTVTPRLSGARCISSPAALLEANLNAVRDAKEGSRRTALYGCARGIARMVAAGAINSTDAQAALMEVGLAAGQTDRDCRAAITGGFRDEGVTL
jgi:hypothetical protein